MPKKQAPENWTTQFNTVTPISKMLALILFITLPMITFILGIALGQLLPTSEKLIPNDIFPPNPPIAGCTLEAKICPDGSSVGRTAPTCEFAPCPSSTSGSDADAVCTMDAKLCPDGSSVGREGPTCEFTPCPTNTSQNVSCQLGPRTCKNGEIIWPDQNSCTFTRSCTE